MTDPSYSKKRNGKQATRYLITSIAGGVLFGILDGLINANPLAQKLYDVYRPISKASVKVQAGILIDLVYGFVMAGVFLLLFRSLPGRTAIIKGLGFGLLMWFFRVVMDVASTWMMFEVPAGTLLYTLIAGLGEMLILGIFFGLAFKTATSQ